MNLDAETRDLLKLLGAGILAVVLLCTLVALFGVAMFFPHRSLPTEAQAIHHFEAHRATFEQLRDMLIADHDLVRLADWGVETTKSFGTRKPPEGDFPLDRYNKYLALLKEVAAVGAFRDPGVSPESVGVQIYASGFAADTRHLNICWLAHEPPNQVSSLDQFYKTPKPRKPVYRHIDGNWYLWADW